MRRKAPVVVGLLLLLAAVAAACGGGDEVPRTAFETGSTAAGGEAPEPLAVTGDSGDGSSKASDPLPASSGRRADDELAPELVKVSSWINSDGFTLASQRGNVVLIDFWTYTCVNCIRTLPFLRSWHEKYADQGLVVLGVHTPEFEFEKLRENVVDAVAGFDLQYPVAQDNEFGTWRAFRNRFWPAKYLIDKDGYIRYTHFGEGAYDETEQKIRELLAETGSDLSAISSETLPAPERDSNAIYTDSSTGRTRELFAGYDFNYGTLAAGQAPPYIPYADYYQAQDADIDYADGEGGDHDNHFIYLQGRWRNEEERLVHSQMTEDYEDYVAIKFFATSVNAVMGPATDSSFTVRLTLNGGPLRDDQVGRDVMYDQDGNSFVLVDGDRMYNLVNLAAFGGHELTLSSNSDQFALFSFTFGDYEGGEPEG